MENKLSTSELNKLELTACTPVPISPNDFNVNAILPHECSLEFIEKAMNDFIDFLGFVNGQLHTREMSRLESMLMAANFSSIVGEFIISNIIK